MSTKIPAGVIKAKLGWVEEALLILKKHTYYGFSNQILEFKPCQHSLEWPVNEEVTIKGRKKPKKVFLYIDFGKRKPTPHLKQLLERLGITRIVLNINSKFRTFVREIAATLKSSIEAPSKRRRDSIRSRSMSHCAA